MTAADMDWRDRAACASSDIAPPAFFDMEVDKDNGRSRQTVKAARIIAASVCVNCPVRVACGDDAEALRLSPGDVLRPFGIRAGYFYDLTGRPPVKAAHASTRSPSPTTRPPAPACPRGHVYDDANEGFDNRGHRYCRECSRQKAAARRAAA